MRIIWTELIIIWIGEVSVKVARNDFDCWYISKSWQAVKCWDLPPAPPVEFLLHVPPFFALLRAQEADPYRLHHFWLPLGFGSWETPAENPKSGWAWGQSTVFPASSLPPGVAVSVHLRPHLDGYPVWIPVNLSLSTLLHTRRVMLVPAGASSRVNYYPLLVFLNFAHNCINSPFNKLSSNSCALDSYWELGRLMQ